MDVILNNLLILTIFFPLAASLLIFVLPDDAKDTARRLALLFSLVPLVLVLIMWFNYDRVDAGMQFETMLPWFPAIGSSFHIGIDGISLAMLLLTTPVSYTHLDVYKRQRQRCSASCSRAAAWARSLAKRRRAQLLTSYSGKRSTPS